MLIRYQALGGNGRVTGSCHLLEIDGIKILFDYGLIQDSSKSIEEVYKLNSEELPIDMSEVSYVVILHSHLDHCGKISMLPPRDFKGVIITTQLTSEIMNLNLRDAAYLHNKEIDRINKRRKKNKVLPLYNMHSAEKILDYVRGYGYNQEIKLTDKVTLELLPASHLSGAAMGLITYKNGYEVKRILFTSDTGGDTRDIPFTKKPNLEKMKINTIITESTYGGREITKSNIVEELSKHIRETCISNNATIIIPAFAIGRSTNVLFYLKQAYDKYSEFKDIPIYLASPMAVKAHSIIGKQENFEFYDDIWKEHSDLWKWDKVSYIDNFEDVKSKLCNSQKKIIIASSGMVTGGYSSFLVANYLPHKYSEILFCGYQGEGTIGRRILEGNHKTINIDGKPIKIRAKVNFLEGMSSHADGNELIELFKRIEKKKLKKFIITHGNYDQSSALKEKLQKEFENVDIYIPEYKQIIKL